MRSVVMEIEEVEIEGVCIVKQLFVPLLLLFWLILFQLAAAAVHARRRIALGERHRHTERVTENG